MADSAPAYLDLVYHNDNMIFTDSCVLDENNDIRYINPDYVHLASPKNVNVNTVVDNKKVIEGFDTQSYEDCPYKKITNRVNLRNNQWNLRNVNSKNWSPTETLKKYTNENKMDYQLFNTFTKSFIRDKCWNEDDFKSFMFISNELNNMLQSAKTDDEKMKLLLNPNFYGYYHIMLDKLDTLNIMCLLNNKSDSIVDIMNKDKVREQATKMTQLIDIYSPIFYRVVDLFEKKLKNINSNSKENIDPIYFELTNKLKSHLLSSNYSVLKTRGQIHLPISNDMNNNMNNNINKINVVPIRRNVINNSYMDDINYMLLIMIVMIILLYVLLY